LDFTDDSQIGSFTSIADGYGGTFNGIGFTLTSSDGIVNFTQRYDGNGDGCQSNGGILKCDGDGAGISLDSRNFDDEITAGQTLTLSFEREVNVNGIAFLDLYLNDNGRAKEQATITFDGVLFDKVNATEPRLNGGYAYLNLVAPTLVQTIEFTAADGRQFRDDRNNDYALAAVDVSPVPLPPAIWLFGTGIVGLAGGIRRRLKG